MLINVNPAMQIAEYFKGNFTDTGPDKFVDF